MKQYWVFLFPSYYPDGGMSDLWETFDTIEEAKKAIDKEVGEQLENFGTVDFFWDCRRCHIWDSVTQNKISYP